MSEYSKGVLLDAAAKIAGAASDDPRASLRQLATILEEATRGVNERRHPEGPNVLLSAAVGLRLAADWPRAESAVHYRSATGLPLVYCGPPNVWPILTVENYLKWYSLQVVLPDGQVKAVDWSPLDKLAGPGESPWRDHVPNPRLCERLPEELPEFTGWVWDEQSLEMIYGRWHRE